MKDPIPRIIQRHPVGKAYDPHTEPKPTGPKRFLNFSARLKAPWPKSEEQSRFAACQQNGHTQLYLKCDACGLEFIVLTWRTEEEWGNAFGKGQKFYVSCPECGTRDQVYKLRTRAVHGNIFEVCNGFDAATSGLGGNGETGTDEANP